MIKKVTEDQDILRGQSSTAGTYSQEGFLELKLKARKVRKKGQSQVSSRRMGRDERVDRAGGFIRSVLSLGQYPLREILNRLR